MSLPSVFAALAADPAALAALLRQIPAGVCVYDSQTQRLASNEAFTRLMGGADEPGHTSPLSALLARARGGETVLEAPLEWPAGGGTQRALASALPVRAGAEVAGLVAVVIDPGAESGQRETLGIVGHDLRNPLAAIRMTAQLLSKPGDMPPERRITLGKRILTSSSRMDSIVKGLLDYARARAGALVRLERETVDLAALATSVIEDQTGNITGRAIELRTRGELVGQWDAGRIEQILSHLVSNALRHGAEGTSVMTLTGEATGVEISLQNQGPPIPAELLPRIFDPFAIGPRPEGTPRRSIGLGLFVVRELARAHGGTVAVESSEAQGTRFTVTLPRQS